MTSIMSPSSEPSTSSLDETAPSSPEEPPPSLTGSPSLTSQDPADGPPGHTPHPADGPAAHTPHPADGPRGRAPRRRAMRLLLGRESDPPWARPGLLALLVATGVLYIWGLGASGWANGYYSAAVQAGATSWKAFFFGSFDGASFITVDKTPGSLWVMALSARVFGVNAWSMLVPQALEGVATVGLLYATVRRWHGPAAGLLAGVVMATTPVAALMFRFNNPDALLVLLMVAGAYCTVRATEVASARWLALAGVAVGFGFLTKMLQAFLVIPVFALVYLVAANTSILRRLAHLLLAGAAVLVSAGWWVAIVELTPAKYRPYIGGSQHNSVLELTLGYNGFGRITGEEVGSVGGARGGNGGGRWGETGLLRMFGDDAGGQTAWLIPAALVFLVAGLLFTLRAARTDRTRAGYLLWGGWLLVNGLTFSLMAGIFHAYYTVALAPAIGALVGMGSVTMLRYRSRPIWGPVAWGVLVAAVLATTWAGYTLLDRTPDWHPWLRTGVLVAGVAAAAVALAGGVLAGLRSLRASHGRRRWSDALLPGTVAVLGLTAALAGPVAYSLQTVSEPHTGSIPSAGPAGGRGGPGGFVRIGGRANAGGQNRGWPGAPGGNQQPPDGNARGNLRFPDGNQRFPDGNRQFPDGSAGDGQRGQGQGGQGQGGQGQGDGQATVPGWPAGAGAPGGLGGPGGAAGGPGGLLNASKPSAELIAKLNEDASRYTWVVAAVGANSAAGYQLASGKPTMAIGGFNGSDATPTLDEFKRYVAEKKIHYFVGGFGMRAGTGSDFGQQISTWVQENFQSVTVGQVTLYDLSKPTDG